MGLKYSIQFQQPPGKLVRYEEFRYAYQVLDRLQRLAKLCTRHYPGLVLTFVHGKEVPYEAIRHSQAKHKR